MTNDTQITSAATRDIDWARHHLFLLIAVAVLVVGSVYSIESVLANRAHEQFIQQQTILAQMQKQNEQVQAQNEAQLKALAEQNAVLQQQFGSLAASISARDAQLFRDRQDIKALPPSQLATKWGSAANEPAPSLDSNNNFIAPLPLAQKSVDALIQVPVLEQDKKDLTSEVQLEKQVAANNDQKFLNEQHAHQSDNDTCKQNLDTKDAEIKDVKAQARKRNILIAIFGAVIGFGLHH